jgi:CheY-like chemotaxis protein
MPVVGSLNSQSPDGYLNGALFPGNGFLPAETNAPEWPVLAGTDYEITEAENGEEALTAIAKQRRPL